MEALNIRKMKYAIVVIITTMTALSACTLETSHNGKLDGMWQLTQLDTLATEGQTDMRETGIFWSVQSNLLKVAALYGGAEPVLFRFQHTGAQLVISDPYIDNRSEGDIKIEDTAELSFYNIDALEQTFSVEQLTSGKMTLQSERFRFHFRKY